MKKRMLSIFMLSVFTVLAFGSESNDKNVQVHNKTESAVFELYVSSENTDDWEEDVLDIDVLLAGDTETITLTGYTSCVFDFKAVFEDDEEVEVYGLDVCEEDLYLYD